MRDIRRPSHSLKYNNINNSVENLKDKSKKIEKDVEMFERNTYQDDVFYDKNGKPIMKASSHFDNKSYSSDRSKSKNKESLDVLERREFFNKMKRDFDEDDIKNFKKTRNKKRKVKNFLLYTILAIVILSLLAWTFLFNFAKVTVNPRYKDIDVSDTFLFFKDDLLMDYSTATMSKEIMKSAPKEIKQKATGEITIYNNYSSNPQVLIVNTRFQTTDGKIFRLNDSITVPGKNGNTPGSIVAKVSADTYGSDYNISPTTFTIPGFKDTARFTGFTAKSIANMTGGASGTVSSVSPEDIATTNNDLKGSINTNLSIDSKKIHHEGYFSLYNSLVNSYSDNQNVLMSSDQSSYVLNSTGTLISIKKDVLAKMIASQILKENYNIAENIHIDNIDNLVFTVDPNVDLNSNVIKILINGKARIIWSYDANNIKASLAGQSTQNFSSIMDNYSTSLIGESYKVSPIWIKTFPSSIGRIKVDELLK